MSGTLDYLKWRIKKEMGRATTKDNPDVIEANKNVDLDYKTKLDSAKTPEEKDKLKKQLDTFKKIMGK